MDFPKPILRPPAPRLSVLSRLFTPSQRPYCGNLWLLISSLTAAAVLFYLLFGFKSSSFSQFGVIIDAGSSGSRIHVFGAAGERGGVPSLDLGATAVMRVAPGLSAYAREPESAGESLVELLKFAKGKVGKDQWGDTEVRLMATAGLRMVEEGVRERILESCRRVLRSSGFRFRDDWATVIAGSDEGIYAWVAANYALHTLGGDPGKTTGIIELGGASAQVTFVSSEPLPPEFSHELKIGKNSYNLYSNSFLHFGQNAAHESLRKLLSFGGLKSSAESVYEGALKDPCYPRGYALDAELLKLSSGALTSELKHQPVTHSGGNFSECRSVASMLLQKQKDNCQYQQCHLGSTFVPKLRGSFIATENFYFTSKFFGLSPTASLYDMMFAGERFCDEDWSKLRKKYRTLDAEDLSRYCFSSAYIVALLHDSLGIALDDRRIQFTNQVGDFQIEWALGAFIMQRTTMNSEPSYWMTSTVRNNSLGLHFFAASVLLVFAVYLVSRWRKPQLKTIYDLEKGRYIITRVS